MKNKPQFRSLPILSSKFVLTVCLLFTFTTFVFGQSTADFDIDRSPLPTPTSPVMDYAGVIDAVTEERIEKRILEFTKSSNPKVEIGVAVVDTTDGIPIFDYSFAVANGWGIGSKEDDNPGALLFIAVKDRKYFTQISYDLEDELPDGLVGSLQRRYLVPEFKQGNYGKGVEDTIDAYIKTIEASQAGEAAPFEEDQTATETYDAYGPDAGDIACCIIGIIGFIIFIWWSVRSANKGGGGKGGSGRRRRNETTASDILIDIAGGLVIGALTGGGSDSDSSWGGSSGGGGSWGGFSGGGSFGGGGSGGSW